MSRLPPSTDAIARASAARFTLTEDPRSRALATQIARIGPSGVNVLICGETGTGKALLAQELHRRSNARGPFHVLSAFAAGEDIAASLTQAAGGALYIDALDALSPEQQTSLLNALQNSEQQHAALPRVIAATAIDVRTLLTSQQFRNDLFYRIGVALLNVPALRERRGDILPLARHFLQRHAQRLGRSTFTLAPTTIATLENYAWPGNIRELENALLRAILAAPGSHIEPEHIALTNLENTIDDCGIRDARQPLEQALLQIFERGGDDLYTQIEARVFRCAYDFCQGNQVQTAQLLDLSRNIVRQRLKTHGLL